MFPCCCAQGCVVLDKGMPQPTIDAFHAALPQGDRAICDLLREVIERDLPEAEGRIWHRHPVWFLEENPTVGYSQLKDCVRLMFWSGADFATAGLAPGTGKFKDASVRYRRVEEVDTALLGRWLAECREVQWDYRGIQKRRGELVRLR